LIFFFITKEILHRSSRIFVFFNFFPQMFWCIIDEKLNNIPYSSSMA
jgi:hypothetical protein